MKPALLLLIILFAICGFGYKAFTQIVNIPDANFKAALVSNSSINTNGDGEIQTSEAAAFSGSIDVNNMSIADLTGIEAFTALTYLFCTDNQLTNLNISANTALTYLNCGSNQITSLDVSANNVLATLWCVNNQITSLNVSANTALSSLGCSNNQLTSLDVSGNTALTELYCNNNQLTSLNVSANNALIDLWCGYNQLTSLDVSGNTTLKRLLCYVNQLTSLNVSESTALTLLSCGYNQLTSLDVSTNIALSMMYCFDNKLTSLNVSGNVALSDLYCFNNQLTILNVKNGNNINFIDFKAIGNPNLTCINVDDSIWSTANWTNIDAGAYFSENCYTGIPSLTNTTEIKTYPNPANNELKVESEMLKVEGFNLTMYDLFGKEVFSTEITENEQSINISKLANGLYTLKIITDSGITVKKIIKN